MPLPPAGHLKQPFSWSPKSDEIAFCYKSQVWKINLNNHNMITLVTEDPSYRVAELEWAPRFDNKYVAYSVEQGVKYCELSLINPRLNDKLNLAANVPIMDLSWSPDARQVAYLVKPNMVYTASAQESLPKLILNNASPDMGPMIAYSPVEGSSSILFLAKQNDTDKGYRVALLDKKSSGATDPGSLKFLTEPGVEDALWSPDGNKIAYLKSGELWIMDSSGSNKNRVTMIGLQYPCWSKK